MNSVSVISFFDRTVAAMPDVPALRLGAHSWTYRELSTRSDRLAAILRGLGIGPGTIVGIALDRSPELICAVLAAIRSGAAYLPLDPAFPSERIGFMLEDGAPAVVMTERRYQHLFAQAAARVLLLDQMDLERGAVFDGPCPAGPDDLCYLLFTSGSSGRPKGVEMPHRALTNLLQWQLRTSVLSAGDSTLQFAPIGFDVSFQEIFTTFGQGGTLVLIKDEDRLNSRRLVQFLREQRINRLILPYVALQYLAEAVERSGEAPEALTELFTSGEQLRITPAVAGLFERLRGCRFCNQYGPTEAHVVSELELRGDPAGWPRLPGIGRPIDGVELLVLDEALRPVPDGVEGELYLAGPCLARGYARRPELTSERFIDAAPPVGRRVYRTGDRAMALPDGTFEYRGRSDGQVKVRGYRIELAEVELALERHPAVRQAAASVREDRPGSARLVAYYVAEHGGSHGTEELRRFLAGHLPGYMIPSLFVAVDSFPLTASGKIDRNALPAPDARRPELDVPYSAPRTGAERAIAEIWGELLGFDRIGIDDDFFDLGGNSLLAIQSIARLEEHSGLRLPIVRLYQERTARACALFLEHGERGAAVEAVARARQGLTRSEADRGVAIIGVSGRFPGADDVDQLWRNLLAARSGIRRFRADELDPGIPAALREDPNYVAARGIIDDADMFDAEFFGINTRLADLMDPQQRVFLELAWAAFEDAGYDPTATDMRVGVFAGVGNNSYFSRNVLGNAELIEQVGEFQVMTANEKDYVATRLAFEFDLRGPAVSVHTACSTSLVAVAMAHRALLDGECDMALAGAASVTTPIHSGAVYTDGGMLSPDGQTRPFDAEAAGTSFSDGAGVVVLKRLADALRDEDRIIAVIRGAALNNDGSDKASFTAPSVRGQAEVIAMAQADAGVVPRQIGYLEAHGTATPLGDPIEVQALTAAFDEADGAANGPWCAIGSIKSNIGHLTAAAGVAGLIKAAWALREGVIPPTLGFRTPNPSIDFAHSPFYVAAERIEWPRSAVPRFAGVSSFGVGGTNAHVVLGEPPLREPGSASRDRQLLLLSAKTRTALDAMTRRFRDFLAAHPDVSLADAAYTLQVGRRHLAERRVLVGGCPGELIEAIDSNDPAVISTRRLVEAAPGVVFLFPGQGSQYVGMGRDLHASEPVFREHYEHCLALFGDALGIDLRSIVMPEVLDDNAAERLRQTKYTQPALFAIQYSLAQLWMHWGIRPDAMIGHSIGEFTAACLAGVFTLEDSVRLVAERGRLMQGLPSGAMLSVRAAESDVVGLLADDCAIAANNGPNLCVASGPGASIAQLRQRLEREGIVCKPLHTSHAFHSPMMDPIVESFAGTVAGVARSTPRVPIVSTVTAAWLKDEEATSPDYWSRHLRATVRFAQAVRFAWTHGDQLMLEVGPRATATTLARQQSADRRRQQAVPCMADQSGQGIEVAAMLRAVGALWQGGISIDWSRFYEGERRHRIALPTYPFARVRHWIEPPSASASRVAVAAAADRAGSIDVATDDDPKSSLIERIRNLLESAAGIDLRDVPTTTGFVELGLDSLFLTQMAMTLSRTFGVRVSFRQLSETCPNLDRLADFMLPQLPSGLTAPTAESSSAVAVAPAEALQDAPDLSKAFGAQARILLDGGDEFEPRQRRWLDAFTLRYTQRTAKSKAYTQAHRAHMADPRVVTGFKPQIKELIFQPVVERSQGCHLWDLDGNEYLDVLSGFGSSMFGYMPEFIREACHRQLDTGIEIGPMHPLAGDVTRLLCELSGHDRAALCNTGSEAVLGAIRMARTVTGRNLIIAFSGSYHGINDEVIIRGGKSGRSYPAAPGIPPEAVQNVLVLDYGTPESLAVIRERAAEAAAVLVEPVQSRRPEFRPVDFLRELRAITRASETALIFDEVITGFRMHPGGAQALFGIDADIGTYGKVIGGGMPIGAMCGHRKWMDALDGGFWQFGDASIPEVGVTYFAGTFVRHPLGLAAANAALLHMKREGPALQERLNDRTEALAVRANAVFTRERVPLWLVNFGSLWKIKYDDSVPYIELFFIVMRDRGIHIWDGFPCFLTTAHSDADIDRFIECLEESIAELKSAGFLPERSFVLERQNRTLAGPATRADERVVAAGNPPHPGARLGRTPAGDPAWFVPDPERSGKYLMLVEQDP